MSRRGRRNPRAKPGKIGQGRRLARDADAQLQAAVDAFNAGDAAAGFEGAERVLARTGRDDAAEVAAHAALHLAPEAAVAAFERLAALRPDDAAILNDWGGLLCQTGSFGDAEAIFRRALEVRPDDASALANLAHALLQQGRISDATAAARAAVDADPDLAAAQNGLGAALERSGDIDGALVAYRRAALLEPQVRAYQDNLLLALNATGGGFDERERIFRARLANTPDDVDALINLVGALRDQGKLAKARETVDRLLALQLSDNEEAHARALLAEMQFFDKDYDNAWENYRWREKWSGFKPRPHPQPAWSGEPLGGKSILVWSEQGVGDEIMFARFLPLLLEDGARVVLETDARLVGLFQRTFPEITVVALADPSAPETRDGIDVQAPIGALGERLWARFDEQRPFRPFQVDIARRDEMRARYLAAAGDSRDGVQLVGIAWRSGNRAVGAKKSIPIKDLAPLLARPNSQFVDLQYGDTRDELAEIENMTGIRVFHDTSFDQLADLDAFAAQVAALDAVVSISNTTAHMAGALGVPALVLLSTALMWRWGSEESVTPWYKSVYLCRQQAAGDWKAALDMAVSRLDGLK